MSQLSQVSVTFDVMPAKVPIGKELSERVFIAFSFTDPFGNTFLRRWSVMPTRPGKHVVRHTFERPIPECKIDFELYYDTAKHSPQINPVNWAITRTASKN